MNQCITDYSTVEITILLLLIALSAMIVFCGGVVIGCEAERKRWIKHNAEWAKTSYPAIWNARTKDGRLGDLLQKLRDKYQGERDA